VAAKVRSIVIGVFFIGLSVVGVFFIGVSGSCHVERAAEKNSSVRRCVFLVSQEKSIVSVAYRA
jgi:hypothetical protein